MYISFLGTYFEVNNMHTAPRSKHGFLAYLSELCDLSPLSSSWNGNCRCSLFDAGALFGCPSKSTVPTPLSDLLDLVEVAASPASASAPAPAPAPPTRQVPPCTRNIDSVESPCDAGVAARQVMLLMDVARLALSPTSGGGDGGGRGAGITPPKARSRALSLDCLGLGLLLRRLARGVGAGGEGGLEQDVLAIAAVGARDGRWEVRVAAARAAGEAMRSWGRTATLDLLSSKQVCKRSWKHFMVRDVSSCACARDLSSSQSLPHPHAEPVLYRATVCSSAHPVCPAYNGNVSTSFAPFLCFPRCPFPKHLSL